MGQQNIIELNGKRYDAITGAILGTSSRGHMPSPQRRTVDGFIRASKVRPQPSQPVGQRVAHAAAAPEPTPITASTSQHPSVAKHRDITRKASSNTKHHQPQKGKTLMRRAVHKPQATVKPSVPAIKVQAPSEIAPASVTAIAHPLAKKMSVSHVDPARAVRATTTSQSNKIRRFQPAKVAAAELKPARAGSSHHIATAPLPVRRPMAFTPATHPQVPTSQQHGSPAHTVQSSTTKAHTDIFEAAIAHARSHEQPAPRLRRSRSKLAGALAGFAALAILGGFVAYVNVAGIEMQVASMKVGFRAQLPEYAPTGYAINGGVAADDGQIRVSFRSGDSSYTVTQQQSDWNSQTLLENYVAMNSSSHQTVQSQGRTIYIYNNSNAAWVDGGIRYDVTGNAPLTANDIVKLATSM